MAQEDPIRTALPTGNAGTRWSVAALLVAMPMVYNPYGYDPALYGKLVFAAVCGVALSLCWTAAAWRGRARIGIPALDVPALLLALLYGLAFLSSINPYRGGLELAKVVLGLAIYFPVSRCVSRRDLLPWTRTACAVLLAVTLLGIAQYAGVGRNLVPSVGLPSSTFFYRNFAAMYLVLALPFAAVPFFVSARLRSAALWALPPTAGALLLVYTRTRGAWVGTAAALAVAAAAVVYHRRRGGLQPLDALRSLFAGGKAWVAAASAAVIVLGAQVQQASYAPGQAPGIPSRKVGVLEAAQSIVQGQHSGRLPVWWNSLSMVRDHLVAGVGLANWALVYPTYAHGEQFRPGFAFLRPHNDYVWIAAELGLPGLAIHVWLLVAGVCLALRYALRGNDRLTGLALLAAALGLVAISGHAFFSFPRERPTPTAFTWLYLGLVAGLASSGRGKAAGSRAAAALPAVLLTVLAGLGTYHIARGFRADGAYASGLRARAEGRWADAARRLDRAVSIGVFDYRYLLQKSQVAQHLGRTEEALAASQACLRVHPNSISAWYNVGQLRAALGDYPGARDALSQTVRLDPDNGPAYGRLGVVYRRMGMVDSARQAYVSALALAPADPIVNYNAAGFYRDAGDVTRAAALYAACVAVDTTFVPAYNGLAEALGQQGDYGMAAALYRKAIALDPAPAEAHYGLGLMLERLGDRAGAARAYQDFLSRWHGDPEVARKVRGYVRQLTGGRQ